jgi:hypothetical protein
MEYHRLKNLSDFDISLLRGLILKELGEECTSYPEHLKGLLKRLSSNESTFYSVFGFFGDELVDRANASPNKVKDLTREDYLTIRDEVRSQTNQQEFWESLEEIIEELGLKKDSTISPNPNKYRGSP